MELVTGHRVLWGALAASEQAPQQPAGAASREDREDIAASLGGDEEAFARLVRRYQAEIVSQLWKYTPCRRHVGVESG